MWREDKQTTPRNPAKPAVVTTAPGEEAQVDYEEGPMVRDPETGKYKRTRRFVLTPGYSRKSVRLLTCKSSAQIWAELHERAFRRLGGSTKVVVLDNLREGVIAPDFYDPTLNRRHLVSTTNRSCSGKSALAPEYRHKSTPPFPVST